MYDDVNNGVYRCGFATDQESYDEAFAALFSRMDWLEQRLSAQRYLVGETITEADVRLFTTLVRFDAVYHTHFKCNRHKLIEFPALWGYARRPFQTSGFGDTVDFVQIKQHYYRVHRNVNPSGIVPGGPDLSGGLVRSRPRTARRPTVRRRHTAAASRERRAGRRARPDRLGTEEMSEVAVCA